MSEEIIATIGSSSSLKCAQCSRKAKQGCSQSFCLKCCTDEQCTVHQEQRLQAMWRDQIGTGTTTTQTALRDKLAKQIPKGRFKEPGFAFLGDTVVIWNLREYLSNPKWKDDALRKAQKRTARRSTTTTTTTATAAPTSSSSNLSSPVIKPLRNNRKRFHRIMERLYQHNIDTL